jgi:enediyne polyketide synthase
MLARGRDTYLNDHIFDGHPMLPAVIGLEAMAQVAVALMPLGQCLTIRDAAFSRAVRLDDNGTLRIRIAALRTGPATEVALLAEDDGFSAPCMQATFSSNTVGFPSALMSFCSMRSFAAATLYGTLFFSRGAFERLEDLSMATSRCVRATLRPSRAMPWFGSFEPGRLILWDPGAADATLHALQVAVPHKRVLPVSAERIDVDATVGAPMRVEAVEKQASGSTYTFDLLACDVDGRVAYRWTNVTFRAVDVINLVDVTASTPMLAGTYIERVAREMLSDETIEIAIVESGSISREDRRTAALRALGADSSIVHREDGRPIQIGRRGSISLAHCDRVTLAVKGNGLVGCDIEAFGIAGVENALRHHVAAEVCRKLGRPATQVPELSLGKPIVLGDVTL